MLLERPTIRYIPPMKQRLVETASSGGGWLRHGTLKGLRDVG